MKKSNAPVSYDADKHLKAWEISRAERQNAFSMEADMFDSTMGVRITFRDPSRRVVRTLKGLGCDSLIERERVIQVIVSLDQYFPVVEAVTRAAFGRVVPPPAPPKLKPNPDYREGSRVGVWGFGGPKSRFFWLGYGAIERSPVFPSPEPLLIRLDDGNIIEGHECYWAGEDYARRKLEGVAALGIKIVPITIAEWRERLKRFKR